MKTWRVNEHTIAKLLAVVAIVGVTNVDSAKAYAFASGRINIL
jgi:hypothetical protein